MDDMAETLRELVVFITHGMDDERSSVAFTIANGQQTDLIDGVEITGASKMHELSKAGAATLSF